MIAPGLRNPSLVPVLAVLAPLVLAACDSSGSTGPEIPEPIDPADAEYAESLDIDIGAMEFLPEGVYYLDEALGEGDEAGVADRVEFHYEAYLPNGVRFDASRDFGDGSPVDFVIADEDPFQRAIDGVDLGMRGMKEGGVRLLVIPAELGYGPQVIEDGGVVIVPPNSILIFRIELLAVN